MSRVTAQELAPLLVAIVVLGTGLWVYQDARRCADEGAPVTLRIGDFVIATPVMWLLGCVVLWVIAFPAYVVSRSR